MAKNLTIHYDEIGDILYIERVKPYAEQDSNYIGDDVVARFNPVTREIENLEIMFFTSRVSNNGGFELPVSASIRLEK